MIATGIFAWNLDSSVTLILCGLAVLWAGWEMRPGQSQEIDSSVNNKIIAHDGHGRYLVQAKTSRQITGPRPHVDGNLPAHLIEVKKGLWVVDPHGYDGGGYDKVAWQPVKGNYHVKPRGSEKRDFLADQMVGWDHNYIERDE